MVLGGNLGQIVANIVKKVKKQHIIRFFLYFTWGKAKSGSVIVKQWKFMANIARNAKF